MIRGKKRPDNDYAQKWPMDLTATLHLHDMWAEICKNRCCSATRQQHVFSVEFFSGAVEISLLQRCRDFSSPSADPSVASSRHLHSAVALIFDEEWHTIFPVEFPSYWPISMGGVIGKAPDEPSPKSYAPETKLEAKMVEAMQWRALEGTSMKFTNMNANAGPLRVSFSAGLKVSRQAAAEACPSEVQRASADVREELEVVPNLEETGLPEVISSRQDRLDVKQICTCLPEVVVMSRSLKLGQMKYCIHLVA
ncbi:hypothetical protein ACLOJK_011206 [Asimina triloba]